MSTKNVSFKIKNVLGVSDLEVNLAPGVNRIVGRNGAGKTSAIRAIERASGGDASIELRDGAYEGSIEGPGVKLSVKRVTRSTGVAEVALAERGALADLIDPGLKDSSAAARARIRALLHFAPLPVDEAAIEKLCGGFDDLFAEVRTAVESHRVSDLLELSELVRNTAHASARQAERFTDEARGRSQASQQRMAELVVALGGDEPIDLDPELAQHQEADLARRLEVCRLQAQGRQQLEARQAEIRSSLGEKPEPSRLDTEISETENRVTSLAQQIGKLQREHGATRQALEGLRSQQTEEKARLELWNQQQDVLAQPIEGPTPAEVAEMEEAQRRAQARTQVSRASHEFRRAQNAASSAAGEADEFNERAESLRTIGITVSDRLAEILRASQACGLTIVNGRLCVVEGGKTLDFETRLSEGQRIAVALRLAARSYSGKVVALDGRYYNALDAENQKELARLAVEYGLYLVTESPTDGELRCETAVVAEPVEAAQ